MADKVIECTGLPEPFTQAFRMVRPGGVVQIAGTAKKEAPVDPRNISLKMITVVDGVRSNMKEAVGLLAEGAIKSKPLMTHFFPLDDIVEAFEQQQRPDECLKVMIDVTD
jgi:threonine dehydrogenase-like Zn-dependent dehydrogenase